MSSTVSCSSAAQSRLGVEAHARADLRHADRVRDELLARLAALVGVALARECERLLDPVALDRDGRLVGVLLDDREEIGEQPALQARWSSGLLICSCASGCSRRSTGRARAGLAVASRLVDPQAACAVDRVSHRRPSSSMTCSERYHADSSSDVRWAAGTVIRRVSRSRSTRPTCRPNRSALRPTLRSRGARRNPAQRRLERLALGGLQRPDGPVDLPEHGTESVLTLVELRCPF